MKNNNTLILEKGYRPLGQLNTNNPPTGGSGVPPVRPQNGFIKNTRSSSRHKLK